MRVRPGSHGPFDVRLTFARNSDFVLGRGACTSYAPYYSPFNGRYEIGLWHHRARFQERYHFLRRL
ncbi:hypothetical protein P692DRAFT_201779862 [Suillus brevipes Sb2]|nr:hypothetical protein P692DRAFT_201779862 [Suillus brevipes Sb2]